MNLSEDLQYVIELARSAGRSCWNITEKWIVF